ncbi:hypothetical protein [Asaia astilbis]|uniref:hypothetical protein n=1 Tax=Asaia astilbis TaxID=610244 RepID=UPI00277D0D35|nr:hypothetical protein [Asaia astilbis]
MSATSTALRRPRVLTSSASTLCRARVARMVVMVGAPGAGVGQGISTLRPQKERQGPCP